MGSLKKENNGNKRGAHEKKGLKQSIIHSIYSLTAQDFVSFFSTDPGSCQ